MSSYRKSNQKTVGLIGLGNIGMLYDIQPSKKTSQLTHTTAVNAHPDFKLAFAVDQNRSLRSAFEEKYQLLALASIEGALSEASPDLIVIATPTDTLMEIFEEVRVWGTNSVMLIEKPMAVSADQGRALLQRIGAQKTFVNYMRQSNPSVVQIRKLVSSRVIQPPYSVTIWYPGTVLNGASHFITLCIGWFGPVLKVRVEKDLNNVALSTDTQNFVLQFADAKVNLISSANPNFQYSKIFLQAGNGVIQSNNSATSFTWHPIRPNPVYLGKSTWSENGEPLGGDPALTQRYVYDELSKSFSGVGAALCDASQGLQTLEVVEKIMSQEN